MPLVVNQNIKPMTEQQKPLAPPTGWIVNGFNCYYRATAVGVAEQFTTPIIKNVNGYSYSIDELKKELIGHKDKEK